MITYRTHDVLDVPRFLLRVAYRERVAEIVFFRFLFGYLFEHLKILIGASDATLFVLTSVKTGIIVGSRDRMVTIALRASA